MSEKHQRDQNGFGYTISQQQKPLNEVVGLHFAGCHNFTLLQGLHGAWKNPRSTNLRRFSPAFANNFTWGTIYLLQS